MSSEQESQTNHQVKRVYRVRVSTVQGQQMMCISGLALVLGVKPDQIQLGRPISPEFIEQARLRADEAHEATGTRDLINALAYWAYKDYDAELRLVELPIDG